jgi:hypothetical protein
MSDEFLCGSICHSDGGLIRLKFMLNACPEMFEGDLACFISKLPRKIKIWL